MVEIDEREEAALAVLAEQDNGDRLACGVLLGLLVEPEARMGRPGLDLEVHAFDGRGEVGVAGSPAELDGASRLARERVGDCRGGLALDALALLSG